MARKTVSRLEPSQPNGGEAPQGYISKDQEFARRLQYYMDQQGWSNSDLARAVWGERTNKKGYREAIGRDRIATYLKGTMPQPKALKQLAEALGVEPHDLSPEHTKASLDWEPQAYSMRAAPGHPDKAHLTVDMIVPSRIAAQIMQILMSMPSGEGSDDS
jgi:transcriptional regulator with XRE-family HTH domain